MCKTFVYVADYTVPQGPAGYACTDRTKVTVDGFVCSGLSVPTNTTNINKSGFTAAVGAVLPGLGVSVALANLEVSGVSQLHSHRGASEGSSIVAGFIASSNKVYMKTLNKGDAIVFPQGLYHFFWNQVKTPATIFVSFSSENPGVQVLETALFQSARSPYRYHSEDYFA